jgi:signal transduction histidine kinase
MDAHHSSQLGSTTASSERRIAELTILYEVSHALQKTVDEQKILRIILAGVTAGRGLGFNRAFVLLADSNDEWLEGRLAMGPSSPEDAARIWREMRERHQTLEELLNSIDRSEAQKDVAVNDIAAQFRIRLSDGENSLLRVLRSHEACLVQDGLIGHLGSRMEKQLLEILGNGNLALAPLYLADRDLGLLIADNAITRAPIELAHLRMLQIFAQAASAAIENARLFQVLTEKIILREKINQTLRESQDHLLRSERLSTIGKMAALLAHEIRTPLVSIGGFARKLLRSAPMEDPRREEMQIIVSEVTHLERLVDEVLSFSRIAHPEFKPVDVASLIRSVMTALQDEIEKNAVKAVTTIEPALPSVEADESQLRQALLNLVTNALDAMTAGGTLSITACRDGSYIEIGVSDTGIGICPENWDRLFSPFFTTKVTGTGLGLAVVSQVIHNHRGSLRFDSIPDRGTAFYIRLALHPMDGPAAPAPENIATSQEARL